MTMVVFPTHGHLRTPIRFFGTDHARRHFPSVRHQKLWITLLHTRPFKDCPRKIFFFSPEFLDFNFFHFPGKDIPAPETDLDSVLGFPAILEWGREKQGGA